MPISAKALHHCLRRLLPHLDAERIALTGGIAIDLYVDHSRRDRTRRLAANDVDFVADDADAVRSSVTSDFLVSHFHLPHAGYPKFLIQLVDPVSHIRLDFFRDVLGAISRAQIADVAGVPLHVLAVRDILAHKLAILSGASAAKPVDEKHYLDAQQLAALCGRQVPPIPASHVANAHYSHDSNARCSRCEASQCASFPLAAKSAILDILGYVWKDACKASRDLRRGNRLQSGHRPGTVAAWVHAWQGISITRHPPRES